MIGSNSQEQCRKILEKYHYETVRKLGKGSYGHVLLTSKFVNAATFYAVKCINLKKVAKDPKLKVYIQQETETMSSLSHPNVVRLDSTFSDSGWYFFVMEYCDMNTLHNYQSKVPGKSLSLNEGSKIFMQILNGLKAIHSNNIIHRDIKCDNIFLAKKKNGGFACKIGDFGFAKVIEKTAKTNCGTTLYMAPEVMSHTGYDQKADIWSVGVVLYYILLGEYPFKTINIEKEIHDKCLHGFKLLDYHQTPSSSSTSTNNPIAKFTKKDLSLMEDFFNKVFTLNPKDRISLPQMFEHPLFNIPETELSTDSTSDDHSENQIEWERNQINYLKRVIADIMQEKGLNCYLREAFRFYLNKVIKMFLKEPTMVKFMNEQPNRPLTMEIKEIVKENESNLHESMNELEKYHKQLSQIQKFFEGFNLYYEQFNAFKQGYRNTVGTIFKEVHTQLPDTQKRSALKFKIFTCHLINRIFKTGVKKDIFPYYQMWLKNGKRAVSPTLTKEINFDSLLEWIEGESSEKLLQSIQVLNKTFYRKE